MRKILLGTTAVVGLALVAQAANAQQARPAARPAPAAAPAAPPPLPATSVAPVGTAAATYQTPVGITGAGPHGADGIPNRPETPTTSGLIVRLGGFFDFSVGNVQDDADKAYFRNWSYNNTKQIPLAAGVVPGGTVGSATVPAPINSAQGRQRTDFRTESEINLYVDGIAANGMRYGAVFELQMDVLQPSGFNGASSGASTGTGVDYDELYGFVKGSWGELRFGQEDSAASLMQVRRPSVLWMGTDDAWDEFTVNSVNGTPYIMSGVNDGNDASKIIYLSPQLAGFDVGLSYSPNRFEGENFLNPSNTVAFQRDFTGLTNEISAALRYRGTFGDVGIAASFVAQFADAARQSVNGTPIAVKAQNVTAYSGGLVVRAFGFAVGGEYTWGNYNGSAPAGASLAKGLDGSKHWVLGGTYTIGALGLGVMYGSGTQDNGANVEDRTQTYLGIGAQYVLAPGMTLFANWNQIEDKNVPFGSVAATGTTLAQFGPGDNTRNIQVLVGGVRVAF
ncbi:MAG: hypothetical protein RLZZ57_1414 [Pseudomonadota bacterium]|jgi:outer membrane protein OmpU